MIIGHKKQKLLFEKIINAKKIPHALLFSGPEQLGKKTMALQLISTLFNANELFNHPDFILITPARKKIQINQIRDLNWKLSLKPSRAPMSGAIIDKAHLMTREAQNCFLKTLEEPKGRSLIILVTESPSFLLSTILSRCETIKFYPVKKKDIAAFLEKEGLFKEKIEEITEYSLGRPGIAIDFLRNPQKLKERKQRERDLIKTLNSPIFFRFKYAEELSKNQNLKEILTIWLSYFRKILISGKSRTSIAKIRKILNLIQETIFLISTTNVNPRLALEVLMLEF